MPEPSTSKILGQIRHILTIVGTVLTTFGYATPDDVAGFLGSFDKIAGPVLIIVGQVWSWVAPEKRA